MDLPRNATPKRRRLRLGTAAGIVLLGGMGWAYSQRNREDAPGARALLRLSVGAMAPTG